MEKMNTSISQEIVLKQLQSILNYEQLKNSQVLSKFLEYIVSEKLSGREDKIKEYTIGLKALGKPNDFNPQLDAIVRIHAGRLRRIVRQYYQEIGMDDEVIIDIPKGTYVPSFEMRYPKLSGVIPTVHENNGTADYNHHSSFLQHLSKPVVAVLPFHNLSSENSMNYFVEGIGEQLSIELARFENISVLSYYSTHQYDSVGGLHELKKNADVDYLLTGSVRFFDEMLRLNMQLVLADTGEIVWTESYQHVLANKSVFEVQEDIIDQILNVLADDNGIITTFSKLKNPSAIDAKFSDVDKAMFQYFEYASTYEPAKLEVALNSLKDVVQTNPPYALVYAMLSNVYLHLYLNTPALDAGLLENSFSYARTAVRLDQHCQHAQKVLAWCFLLNGNKSQSLETFEQCIKINPKASTTIASMALAYACAGETTKSFRWLIETSHLNPFTPPYAKLAFAIYYYSTGNYRESEEWLQRVNSPETPFFVLLRLAVHGKTNHSNGIAYNGNMTLLKEHGHSIVSRLIIDTALRNEIIDGLRLAEFPVK